MAACRLFGPFNANPFFAFGALIGRIICTTNAVESLNRVLRNTLKTRGPFPTARAATTPIHLAIGNRKQGGRAVRERVAARHQRAIMVNGRFDAREPFRLGRRAMMSYRDTGSRAVAMALGQVERGESQT
ncbi:transposase [Paracoccus sp. EGI L200073]|nr:transposase [Paracoccus salsus]MCF3972589.1 transposase [Paracoccus salsus]